MRCELDSHADTCLAGSNFIAYEYTDQSVSIHGFDDNSSPVKNVPVATCMTALTLPDGETVILVVHQALYLGNRQKHSLLCPNQLRKHGVRVDYCPKHLSLGMNSKHSITVREEDLEIPLEMDGVISYFNSHQPTPREIRDCRHIELTSQIPWDPGSKEFEQDENNYASKYSGDPTTNSRVAAFARGNEIEAVLESVEPALSENFLEE